MPEIDPNIWPRWILSLLRDCHWGLGERQIIAYLAQAHRTGGRDALVKAWLKSLQATGLISKVLKHGTTGDIVLPGEVALKNPYFVYKITEKGNAWLYHVELGQNSAQTRTD